MVRYRRHGKTYFVVYVRYVRVHVDNHRQFLVHLNVEAKSGEHNFGLPLTINLSELQKFKEQVIYYSQVPNKRAALLIVFCPPAYIFSYNKQNISHSIHIFSL